MSLRVVLDTNIWISGLLLPTSPAGKILTQWREARVSLVTSPPLIAEIGKVLVYPKINKRLEWSKEKIETYLTTLRFFTEVIEIDHLDVKVESAPDDGIILATLIASHADYLITGDRVLLEYAKNYPVLSLKEFTEKFL